jgi:hypothetical protein
MTLTGRTEIDAPAPSQNPPTGGGPAGPARRVRRRRCRRIIALLLVLLMVPPTVSYVRALTYPGSASWQTRTVEWVRDNQGAALVNALENWYYTRHQPSNSPPSQATLPKIAPSLAATRPAGGPPPLHVLPGRPRLPGEATWAPRRLGADGRPLLYWGYIRPDPAHSSVVTGVAWMRAGATVGHLVAGTREPGGSGWPGGARIAPADVPNLVATFNSGFRMRDITGGFYAAGRTARPLVNGQASVVVDRQGRITIVQWGRDVSMSPNIVAVRQNLALVVDGGKPVAGLTSNAHGRWGNPRNQYQYTWRSGAGIDRAGNLIYVAGTNMDLKTLAAALVDAGAVRGMQLDIHPGMASFASWMPPATGRSSIPAKLLPGMTEPADRYLIPDQRDFIYLTAR